MKCNKCGYESEQDFKVCAACGAEQGETAEVNAAAEKIFPAIKDTLFLAICILQTVYCAASLISGNVQIINILLVIFMWQIYAKGNSGIVDVKNMRYVSGTVYAYYVVIKVACIIMAVAFVIFGIAFTVMGQALFESGHVSVTGWIAEVIATITNPIIIWFIVIAVLVVVAAAYVINTCSLRRFHRLAKSVYQSVQEGNVNLIENAHGAKVWLWVWGIFSALSALGNTENVMLFIANACNAASTIVAAVLVDKYLLKNK